MPHELNLTNLAWYMHSQGCIALLGWGSPGVWAFAGFAAVRAWFGVGCEFRGFSTVR